VEIDEGSPDWPYQQLAARIRERITRGELGPKLPTLEILAEQAGVSPTTVQRALKILKDEGLVYGMAGRGIFVRQPQ
jgi:DNA-binding GntR family transcriptional regulator